MKVGITSLLIIKYNTYIIKNVINKLVRPRTKNLILYNIIVIKGFYINIVSETCLAEKKA